MTDLTFRIASEENYEDVISFLYANFHRDEPMSKALELVGEDLSHVEALDEFGLHALKDNLSLIATDTTTGKLMGVCINLVAKKQDDTKEEPCTNPKFAHILEILRLVNEKGGNLYDQVGVESFFDIKMVATDKVNRKSGLGTELLKRSVELSRILGFRAVKAEATGFCCLLT